MIEVANFYNTLTKNEITFFVGVPDSLLKNICSYITDNTNKENNIISANEGNAVAIAAGYHIATNKIPLVYMQNSGIGNAVNPLLSLADKKVYSIPMLLMIGWRGEPGIKDEPQHLKQGEVTTAILDAMKIKYEIIDHQSWQTQLENLLKYSKTKQEPVAILVRKNSFGKYQLKYRIDNKYPLTREEALKTFVNSLPDSSILVSTTGKLSRELFEFREEQQKPHNTDFLTVGSMGHSSSITLGIALSQPKKKIFCLDGDGSLLMHTGSTANVTAFSPKNYVHVVFNNGAHESVGGQPTNGFKVNFIKIAEGFGYQKLFYIENKEDLINKLPEITTEQGPIFIEIRVNVSSRENLGRPSKTPIANKNDFMKLLLDS